MSTNIYNSGSVGALVELASHRLKRAATIKQSFVDPATMGAGGGDPAAGGMDPAAMGMDPAAMGMDPAAAAMGDPAAGAAPMPAPPPAEGGGGMETRLAAIEQQLSALAAGGGGAAAGGIKPKVDTDSVLLSLQKMVAKLLDANNIQMPAQDMVADANDLGQMAADPSAGNPAAGAAPSSAIPPVEAMAPAMPAAKAAHLMNTGQAVEVKGLYSSLAHNADRASAISRVLNANR